MTIREKIMLEESKKPCEIVLHREGLFFVAYEHSAYLTYKAIHQFKVSRKYVKTIGLDIVSIGFPATSTEKWMGKFPITMQGEAVARVDVSSAMPTDDSGFEPWKKNITEQKEPVLAGMRNEASLMKMLNEFPIENKTPMECMLFLSELKKMALN